MREIRRISRLRHVLKTAAMPALYGSGLLRLAGCLEHRPPRRIALNYHDVEPHVFEKHAIFLKEHADIVGIDTFLERSPDSFRRPLVTLTFDDGYASFIQEILPVLQVFRFPATWFIPTALIGTQEIFWFDRLRAAILQSPKTRLACNGEQWSLQPWNRVYVVAAVTQILKQAETQKRAELMAHLLEYLGEPLPSQLRKFQLASVAQMRNLDHDRVTLGSHSHTHAQLTQLTDAEMAEEFQRSKQLLEEWTGLAIKHFAFPSGNYDDRVDRGLQAVGYLSAWTTEPGFVSSSSNCYRLPRIAVDNSAPVSILAAKMTPLVHRMGLV